MAAAIVGVLSGFVEAPLQTLSSGYSALEGACNYYRDQSPALFQLYHKVQEVFLAVNSLLLIQEAAQCIDFLEKQLTQLTPLSVGLTVAGWTVVAAAIMACVDWMTNSSEIEVGLRERIPEEERRVQQIEIQHTEWEHVQCFVYAARLVSAVALVAISYQPPIIGLIQMASLGYSLLKMSEIKWLQFSREFDIKASMNGLGEVVDGVIAKYLFPLIPDRREALDECPMCLEEAGPKVYFCPDKSYHVQCLPELFLQGFPKLLSGWTFTREIIRSEDRETGKVSEVVTYPSSIPRGNLPVCPDCRRNPTIDHQLYFQVHDTQKGNCESGLVTLRGE